MGVSELLQQLANPQAIHGLSFIEKMAGGLVVTLLGMGITFLALILLQVIIDLLARIVAKTEQKPLPSPAARVEQPEHSGAGRNNDEELVAAISAALAMTMQKPAGDIAIRNIRRIEEPSPLWNRAGILDQMNTRL